MLLVLALAAAGLFWWLASQLPGAGAIHQQAPEVVAPGQAFGITVRAAVWGGGGHAASRYSDMRLQLLLDGQAVGPALAPVASEHEADQLVFRFQLQAPPTAQRSAAGVAALRWQLLFRLDGQPRQVDGPHAIAIRVQR